MFDALQEKLEGVFRTLRGQGSLSAADVEAALREIRLALLEADVHFKVAKQFLDRVSHVHVKDVSPSLAAAVRGQQTGIAVSQCAIGDGVNADNIRQCLTLLRDHGYTGVLSMECEGQAGPMIEKSLAWVRKTLDDLKIPVER